MSNRSYTVFLIPDCAPRIRRVRVRGSILSLARWAAALSCAGAIAGAGAIAFGLYRPQPSPEITENQLLGAENLQLRTELRSLASGLAALSDTLNRVDQEDRRLRDIALSSQTDRQLAIGPLERMPADPGLEAPAGRVEDDLPLQEQVASLGEVASRLEGQLQRQFNYFQDQRTLLASTPSIWPTHGFVTSDFGQRVDPISSEDSMHPGLDIGTAYGSPILAPADGTAVIAGSSQGGYGNVVVLDHGHGIRTRYGHLSLIGVRPGQHVRRREWIGAVGTTGRSTGPHLHYEVWVNGSLESPRKFILE